MRSTPAGGEVPRDQYRHPSSGGDAANFAALNAVIAELA